MASWRKGVGGGDGGLDVEQGMGKKGGRRWKIKEGFWGWGVCGWIWAVRDGNGSGWVVTLAAYGDGPGTTHSSCKIYGFCQKFEFLLNVSIIFLEEKVKNW